MSTWEKNETRKWVPAIKLGGKAVNAKQESMPARFLTNILMGTRD